MKGYRPSLPEEEKRCQHPEFVKPITVNKARNRRPMATSFGGRASRKWEWCELCWKKVPRELSSE